MHIHISALDAVNIFLAVIVLGFLWRSAAAAMARSDNPTVATFGQGMSIVY